MDGDRCRRGPPDVRHLLHAKWRCVAAATAAGPVGRRVRRLTPRVSAEVLAQFRVVATDGVHSAFADTPPLTLANKPPQPRILTPGSDGKIYAGQLVNFEGEATDPQDGVVVDTGLAWRTPGRTLGSGSRLSITDLPVGANRGHADRDQQPRPLGLHDGHRQRGWRPEPTWPDADRRPDRDRMACRESPGGPRCRRPTSNVGNGGAGRLEFTANSSAAWLTVSATTGVAPATLTPDGKSCPAFRVGPWKTPW